jgi:hypothetical protein
MGQRAVDALASTVPDLGDPGRQLGAASPEGLDLMLSVANLAYILATDRHMRLHG